MFGRKKIKAEDLILLRYLVIIGCYPKTVTQKEELLARIDSMLAKVTQLGGD